MPAGNQDYSLPGEALIRLGIEDYEAGRHTPAACLVRIARTRLSQAGLLQKTELIDASEAELDLYRLLREQGGDAYSRYNSLLRELVSFENALDAGS